MKTALSWILQLIIVAALGFAAVKYVRLPKPEKVTDTGEVVVETAVTLPVETLTPQTIAREYVSLAKVEEWQSSTLATQASGRVIWTCECFEEGQAVEAGTRLLQIDPTPYNRDVLDRQKDLLNARAKLTEAEAETSQARENYARLDLGEPNDIALKLPELEAAKLAVTSAEAALDIANDKLAETDITAPYAGILSKVGATTGDLIGNGANLGTLVGTDVFMVRFPMLENQLALAEIGREIRIETTTQPVIVKTGVVKAIEIDIDQTTRLNSVIVAVEGPLLGDVLRIGRFVNGTFTGAPLVDVFAVPLVALDNEMNYYVVGSDDRLEQRHADPVYRDFGAVYLDAGAQDALRIVTGSVLGLRAGMLVRGYDK